MEKQTIWELITNQLPIIEKQRVWEEINASPHLTTQYQEMKKAWSLSASNERFSEQELDGKYKLFNQKYRTAQYSLSWAKSIFRYAAVIAVTMVCSYFVLHRVSDSAMKGTIVSQMHSGQGSINSFKLSDGSQIWLNSGSEIKIQSQTENRIELELSGEALFDVIHNEEREFVVNVGDLVVKDLGTRFNIRNYSQDNEVLTTLLEGEIAVSSNTKGFTEEMYPGQQLRYNKTDGRYWVEEVDTLYVGDWKEDKFKFVDKALKDIAVDIENWYGVKIEFKNNNIAEEHFTGVIQKSTSIEQVMQILSYSAGIKYTINEKNNQKQIMIK